MSNYWFWNTNGTKKNTGKKVVISEVEELLRNCVTRGQITRDDFETYCGDSNQARCSFAVTVRMLEYLDIARYLGGTDGFKIIDGDLAEQLIKMERICGVSWHGEYRKAQIEVGEDVEKFFSKEQRDIILHIGNNKYYSKLPDCFFTTCKHLRTACDDLTYKGTNRLHEWLVNNNIERVKLKIITKYTEFRLSKYESNQ